MGHRRLGWRQPSRAEVLSISSKPGSPRPTSRLAGYKAHDGTSRQLRRPLFHAVIIGLVIAAAFYASFLPNRSATRASGFINPSEGLTFSGAAVVVQQQTSALKQTTDTAAYQTDPSGAGSADFQHAGLLPGTAQDTPGFGGGLLSPLESPPSVASSSSAEDAPTTNPDGTTGDTNTDTSSQGTTSEGATDNSATAPSNCKPSSSSLYCVYEVQEGDTLSTIADLFGLTSNDEVANYDLLVNSNKPDIVSADDFLQPGQNIRVPLYNGVLHTVLSAETLTDIADEYGVTVDDILAVPGNGISDPNAIGIGTEILVPDPQQFAPAYVPDDTVAPDDSTGTTDNSSAPDDSSSSSDITGGGPVSSAGFIWPAAGPITSYFGPSHPLGIDIGFGANGIGIPISAAAGGVVTFAGGDPCCSYGNYVVVDHGNGFQTLYAHLSSISVSVGEVVAQGQQVGLSGTTGYSTGPHLHFEVHKNGSVVNPLNYLP